MKENAEEGDLVREMSGFVRAKIRMQAASWVTVDEVRLLVNGSVVGSWPVPRVGETTPLFEMETEVRTSGDSFITAEARGDKPLPPFVVGEWAAISAGTCPPNPGKEAGMAVFAVTNPVFIDADGDGRYRGPMQPTIFPCRPDDRLV